MTGAGISVSAGIPDFRSPKTGVYANLQKYNLPSPESLFHIGYFLEKPEAFYAWSKEFEMEGYDPTPTHWLIRMFFDKGILS